MVKWAKVCRTVLVNYAVHNSELPLSEAGFQFLYLQHDRCFFHGYLVFLDPRRFELLYS